MKKNTSEPKADFKTLKEKSRTYPLKLKVVTEKHSVDGNSGSLSFSVKGLKANLFRKLYLNQRKGTYFLNEIELGEVLHNYSAMYLAELLGIENFIEMSFLIPKP